MSLSPPRERALLAAYVVALAALSLLGLGRGLWTPDEPREAEISREMYLRPSMLLTLNGERFYEKPPLYYWAVAGAFGLTGGPSVAAARAVSGLAGFATLLLVLLWGRRAASLWVGVVASAMLATSVQFVVSTHWVLIDPLLMLFCTLAAWSGWEALRSGGALRFVVALYASAALALWTKGLIGPVLLGAGLLAYCILERRQRPWRAWRPFAGAALLGAALAVLVVAIYLEGGRQALWEWGWVNHVQRFLDPSETGTGHKKPLWYYLRTLPTSVLPWLLPLIGAFVLKLWRASPESAPLRRYCAAFVAGQLVILSLSSTKRETYLLPLLPVLFVLLALTLRAWWDSRPPGERTGAAAWAQVGLCALVGLLPPVAVAAYTRAVTPGAAIVLVLALAAAGALVVAAARARLGAALVLAAACTAVGMAGALVLAPGALHRDKDFDDVTAAIRARFRTGAAVPALGADETLRGIVPFATGMPLERLTVADLLASRREGLLLPPWLVVQTAESERADEHLDTLYELDTIYDVGPQRRIALWRLRPTAASPSR